MIEDKKDGIKIAENKFEVIKEKLIKDNEEMNISIELNKAIIKYIEKNHSP